MSATEHGDKIARLSAISKEELIGEAAMMTGERNALMTQVEIMAKIGASREARMACLYGGMYAALLLLKGSQCFAAEQAIEDALARAEKK